MASPTTEITIGKHIFCIKFVPQSQAVYSPGWGPGLALHWVIEIRSVARRHDVPPHFLYREGVGHIPNLDKLEKWSRTVPYQNYVKKVCESGRYIPNPRFEDINGMIILSSKNPLPFPKVGDILHCLMLDAEAMGMDFEDWCDTFEYDNDSIKALKTYEACVENGRKLIRVFGRETYNQLANVYADGEEVWNEGHWEAVLRSES